ncbi:MAG TPA: GTP 3',8-cyclase MoaA [Candidatus Omnitrophica bacterium]|nr:MAG: cyclic pyranopterin phosphate synthase [Omnitrophica WOR_2 bacterium GWA2_53_43]HBO96715.1 GTP 3',8-cyclase MoaA [Candidatus Omnitrophota bacterium]HCI44761.1 GTP 3',8-cyclase MoaA [Candidatus Omnitrophota bacterium]
MQKANSIHDTFLRPLKDLRISVIDRCNFRCTYCMPDKEDSRHYSFLKSNDWLTFEEVIRLTKVFVGLGVTKIRLTGGEPLLRPNLVELVGKLRAIEGVKDLALTTNGSLLSRYAPDLKDAGLDRITVSLDTMDARLFHQMNGNKGDLKKVLEGIHICEELDFPLIKINVVLQKGVNDHSVMDLVRYFKGRKPVLRFIEYMDVGNCNHWDLRYVVPTRELVDLINGHFPLRPLAAKEFGEVAARYEFADGSGEIGFISSVTQPFCGTCTRGRISAEGRMYACLFAGDGVDLRAPLRAGAADVELSALIQNVWQKRTDRYSELRTKIRSSPEHAHKVEMFQIGG